MSLVVGIRHAEVENPHGVVYARASGFPLSERGREEAGRLGAALAGAAIGAVHASPLERAVETARAIAEPHGLEVQVEPRLIEWGFWSRWQGTSWARLREHMPEVLDLYATDPVGACPEDPLDRVGARVLEWADEASARHPDEAVVGVSHESPLIAAYLVGRGSDFSTFRAVNVPHLQGVRLAPRPTELVDAADARAEPASDS